MIRSLRPEHKTRIESFQPYKRGQGGRHSPLFLLQELNNTDKHRLLTVIDPGVTSITFTGIAGGVQFNRRMPLRMNAKIGWARDIPIGVGKPALRVIDTATGEIREAEMQVNITVAPGVRFGNSCEAVQRLPVIGTLQRITNEVSRIVESFANEFPS